MEGRTTSLWLFLLLNQPLFCLTDANLSTTQLYKTENTSGSSSPALEPSPTSDDHTNSDVKDTNGLRYDCLIDTEMGLIAVGSAGGLIVCLLVATVVLACQVCHLQHRVYAPQTSRSNMDLVSGTVYWGTDLPEVGGLVGPYDTSVMLEEVRADSRIKEERQADIREAGEGARVRLEEGATAMDFDPDEKVPRNLENMPLVV